MLPSGTVAYFVLNLELTRLSLTTHILCIFVFPTACVICLQYQNMKIEPSIRYCLVILC